MCVYSTRKTTENENPTIEFCLQRLTAILADKTMGIIEKIGMRRGKVLFLFKKYLLVE
jgi:hypothetical protein